MPAGSIAAMVVGLACGPRQSAKELQMGMPYTLRLYKGTDAAGLRNAMVGAATSLGGRVHWDQFGLDAKSALRLAHRGDVHTVYVPYQSNGLDFIFCKEVGRRLNLPWLELRIQEGSIWDYALYRGDALLDKFSVCPQYLDRPGTLPFG
jgi:hypothetical protein